MRVQSFFPCISNHASDRCGRILRALQDVFTHRRLPGKIGVGKPAIHQCAAILLRPHRSPERIGIRSVAKYSRETNRVRTRSVPDAAPLSATTKSEPSGRATPGGWEAVATPITPWMVRSPSMVRGTRSVTACGVRVSENEAVTRNVRTCSGA